jgi:hypothetical protein
VLDSDLGCGCPTEEGEGLEEEEVTVEEDSETGRGTLEDSSLGTGAWAAG